MSGPPTESTPSPDLRITLLGVPQWSRDGQPARPLAARDAALLALLAVEGSVARDRAAAWLWPDAATQAHANLSLRQRLFRLRRECGHALVDAGLSLSLVPGVQVDLHAQPLPTDGELLAGTDVSAFEAFDEWLRLARTAIGARQADALAGEVAALEDRGALAEAIVRAERIVARWPATERTWRQLMRLHWRRADRAAAVAAFERFEQQVCREWGLRPSAETLALLATIEQREAGELARGRALPPALLHPPTLVGRDDALDALAGAWAERRAALVLAPGGMGKSRLLEHFCAGRPGVLQVRARPGDVERPYATLAQALDDALTQFSPRLRDATQAELSRLLPRLGPPPSGPAQEARLRAAVCAAWQAAMAQGLTAVVWDDLHWADAATLDLLHALLAEPAMDTLRQVFAARPAEGTAADAPLSRWLGDSLRVLPVRLVPWRTADLRVLLPTLGLPSALASDLDLAERLQRQSGGQPFFVLETLKTLVLAARTGAAPSPAPAVTAMVVRRVAALSEPARQLLQLLAVAAAPVPLPLASQVLGRTLPELAVDWSALADALLVRDDGLAHDLVRDAVLSALPTPAVQAMHHALARALAGRPGIDPSRLAIHWQAADAHAEATEAWLRAAAAAVRTGRLTEAMALFQRATVAATAAGDHRLQVAALAAAQPTRLLREGPAAAADALQALRDAVHDPALRCRLLLLQAEIDLSRMQPEAADAAAAAALALCDGIDADADPQLLSEALLMQGRTLAWTGRGEAGVHLLQAACERAEAEGDLRRRLEAQSTLADVLAAAGRRVEAEALQRRTAVLARGIGDRLERAVVASNLALYALLVGDAAGAFDAASQALAGFDAMGVEHVNRVMCASVFALAAAHHGRFDLVHEATAAWIDGPEDPVRRNLRNTLSTVALWRGQPEEAAALLPALTADAPLSVRVTGLFARLRWCAWTGGDDGAERAALAAIGAAHPQLRDDAHYYRAWAPFDAPEAALARLDRLAAREAQAGASGLARTLALVALQIATAQGRSDAVLRARALAPQLAQGLHPGQLPSEAWLLVAQALHAAGDHAAAADACAHGRAWVAAARLPAADPAAIAAFTDRHPVHARLHRGFAA